MSIYRTDDLNQHEASAEAGADEKLALGGRRLSLTFRLCFTARLDQGLGQRLHAGSAPFAELAEDSPKMQRLG